MRQGLASTSVEITLADRLRCQELMKKERPGMNEGIISCVALEC